MAVLTDRTDRTGRVLLLWNFRGSNPAAHAAVLSCVAMAKAIPGWPMSMRRAWH